MNARDLVREEISPSRISRRSFLIAAGVVVGAGSCSGGASAQSGGPAEIDEIGAGEGDATTLSIEELNGDVVGRGSPITNVDTAVAVGSRPSPTGEYLVVDDPQSSNNPDLTAVKIHDGASYTTADNLALVNDDTITAGFDDVDIHVHVGGEYQPILDASAIPDSDDLHSHFDAASLSSVDPWPNEAGGPSLSAVGGPTILEDEKNGLNVVDYDGVDDYHATDWSSPISQPFQYFIVFKIDTLASPHFVVGGRGPSTSGEADFRDASGEWQIFAGSGIGGATPDTSWHIANVLFDGPDSRIRIDGTTVATGDPGSGSMGGLSIAELLRDSGRFHDMKMAEFALFPMDKTNVESDVETYLNDKWAVF